MRKNNFLNIVAALWMGVVAAVGLTACSSEDNFDNNQQPAQSEVHTYSVCIPASFGDAQTRAVVTGTDPISGKPNLVGQFKTTENIMVYNVDLNKKAENSGLMYLHPDADDATTANLIGNLLFEGTVAEGQTLKLFYNASGEEIDYYVYPSLYQSGTLAGLSNYDFAVAEVTISGISGSGPYTLTTSAANFVNLQSMFKFTFTGLPTGVGVQKLAVSSANRKIVTRYYPISGSEFTTVPIEIILDDAARTANGAGVVYASIRFLSGEDDITFTVTGTDGNTYTATKHTTGFSNGKYYQSTVALSPTLASLKSMINSGIDCSAYIGYQVNSDGVIAASGVSGTLIGYIGYISTTDVDTGVSGSRILVVASSDDAWGAWGSKGTSRGLTTDGPTGYSFTNTLQAYGNSPSTGHPAAYNAWNHSAAIPIGGATPAHWFLPTQNQLNSIITAVGGFSQMTKIGWCYDHHWTSTEYNEDHAVRIDNAGKFPDAYYKETDGLVRACFAY